MAVGQVGREISEKSGEGSLREVFVGCQWWVCADLGGGQTWAEFLGLLLASVCASPSQCPQWGCCEDSTG